MNNLIEFLINLLEQTLPSETLIGGTHPAILKKNEIEFREKLPQITVLGISMLGGIQCKKRIREFFIVILI